MANPVTAPYGSWKSPITSTLLSSAGKDRVQLYMDGEDIYWLEMRPTEGGRYVLIRYTPDGQTVDVTPPPYNVRTLVHEYGGGSYIVADGTVYFSNFTDQRLYRQDRGSQPRPITPEGSMRYANAVIDRRRKRLICVREDHTHSDREAVNTLVGINIEGMDNGQILVSGNDFYAFPRISPDGSRLAWMTWNHPYMPWDRSELWVADLDEAGKPVNAKCIAGGEGESVYQPEFAPDGSLYFISDSSGWWNLYRLRNEAVEPMCEMEAEFGLPLYLFEMRTYDVESAGRLICTYSQNGNSHFAILDTKTKELKELESPYTSTCSGNAGHGSSVRARPGQAVFFAGSPTIPLTIVQLDVDTGNMRGIPGPARIPIDKKYLSMPEAIEFPTYNGLTAHAFFYRPVNGDYNAPGGEKPPCIAMMHGGPHGNTASTLNLMLQYWTSRGFAVVDINYSGSIGYGRAYQQRLEGQYGIVDIKDCVNCVRYLADKGLVDKDRLIIRGHSAGGYATLCALTFTDVFKAGASYCGVSDVETMAKETHKFQSRYVERLMGPYPENRGIYRERSPINYADKLSCPIIFFQGLGDKVVPPNQAEKMVEALRTKGIPVAYLPFANEEHHLFRHAENIKKGLDAELYFYSKVFGFELAEPVEPVLIENL